jgi:basic membrane protein A
VDATWDTYPDNLRGIIFASDEVGYFAGTLAGLMSTSKVIGAIGGLPIPPVDSFIFPINTALSGRTLKFRCCWITPTILVTQPSARSSRRINGTRGADVIFAVAGPTGIGVNLETAQAGAWTIGVDVDVYYKHFWRRNGGRIRISAHQRMKRVDNAVYHTIEDVVNGHSARHEWSIILKMKASDLHPITTPRLLSPGRADAVAAVIKALSRRDRCLGAFL